MRFKEVLHFLTPLGKLLSLEERLYFKSYKR